MVTSKKKIIISVFLILALLVLFLYFYFASRVYWKYDDGWMLGKSRDSIGPRYGNFDLSIDEDREVYLIKDNPFALIYDGDKGYFVMTFDDQGRCEKIYRYVPPGF